MDKSSEEKIYKQHFQPAGWVPSQECVNPHLGVHV